LVAAMQYEPFGETDRQFAAERVKRDRAELVVTLEKLLSPMSDPFEV